MKQAADTLLRLHLPGLVRAAESYRGGVTPVQLFVVVEALRVVLAKTDMRFTAAQVMALCVDCCAQTLDLDDCLFVFLSWLCVLS
jgi:hypothetical protein